MFGLLGRKKVRIGEILFFSLSYTQGCMVDSNASYRLEWKDGSYVASVKPMNEPEENTQSIPVPEDFARKLEKLLTDYQVGKWNGFHKYDKLIDDGKSFNLVVLFRDENRINARGYMRWPKNYRDVKNQIISLFSEMIA